MVNFPLVCHRLDNRGKNLCWFYYKNENFKEVNVVLFFISTGLAFFYPNALSMWSLNLNILPICMRLSSCITWERFKSPCVIFLDRLNFFFDGNAQTTWILIGFISNEIGSSIILFVGLRLNSYSSKFYHVLSYPKGKQGDGEGTKSKMERFIKIL